MSHYRGHYMKDDRIAGPAIIDATDDAEALRKASESLSASQFLRIELWHGFRNVGTLSAPAPPHEPAEPTASLIQPK